MTLTTERAGARAQLECDCWERWTNSHSHLFYYEFLRETEWKRMDRWHKQVGCVPHRKLNSSVCNRYAFRILFIGRFHSHTVRVCGFVSVALVCLAIARWPAIEPVSSGFESEIQLNAFGTIAGRTVSVGLTVYSKWSGRNALMCAGIKLYFMCVQFSEQQTVGQTETAKIVANCVATFLTRRVVCDAFCRAKLREKNNRRNCNWMLSESVNWVHAVPTNDCFQFSWEFQFGSMTFCIATCTSDRSEEWAAKWQTLYTNYSLICAISSLLRSEIELRRQSAAGRLRIGIVFD